MKVRNLILSFLVAAVLIGPASLLFVQKVMHLDLPTWLTSEDATTLQGGNKNIDLKGAASLKGFREGELQSAIEQKINQHIPIKGTALLINSSLQRSFIEASNALFKWDCFPTFYGSHYIYSPSFNTISQIAPKRAEETTTGICAFINRLASYARNHNDIDFVVYFAPSSRDTESWNPSNKLISNAWTYQGLQQLLLDEQDKVDNLAVLFWNNNSDIPDEGFFRYDHHWNIKGAVQAYQQICAALQIEALRYDEFRSVENIMFYGSQSRESLYMHDESVEDVVYDFSNLEVTGTDYNVSSHDTFWNATNIRQCFDFHELYFGDLGDAQIEGGIGETRMLLIGDSYANCLTRLLAESSSSLKRDTCLYGGHKSSSSLSQLIEAQSADSVIFVARSADFATFLTDNPSFFE